VVVLVAVAVAVLAPTEPSRPPATTATAVGDGPRKATTRAGNPAPTGTPIFDGTRKAAWPGVIEAAPDRITDVPDPLGGPGSVLKFTVRDRDVAPLTSNQNPRAQLQTPEFIKPGDEIWYGGRILFPAGFPAPTTEGWVATSSVFGPPYRRSSPAAIGITKAATDREEAWGLVSDGWKTRYWGVPLSKMRGRWVTWLVHEKFAAHGWMEVWIDGRKVMARRRMKLVDSSNDGGANHITQTFYRYRGMWPVATMYQADFGVWRVD
jgi:Polysaccharide lyase